MPSSAREKKLQAKMKRSSSHNNKGISNETQEQWAKNTIKASDIFSDNEDSDEAVLETRTYSESIMNTNKKKPIRRKSDTVKQKPQPDSDSDCSNVATINTSFKEPQQKQKKRQQKTKKRSILSSSSDEDNKDEESYSDSASEREDVDDVNPEKKVKSMGEKFTKWMSEKACETQARILVEKSFKDSNDLDLAVAFKGGKESCALLHIIKTVMLENNYPLTKLKVLYFQPMDDHIEQMCDYIEKFVKEYKMQRNLITIKCRNLSEGLNTYMMDNVLHSIFIGVKSTDVYADKLSQSVLMPDGHNLLRVYPMLSWSYKDVWDYLKKYNVSLPELYNFGYTCIDKMSTTIRNPYLSDKRADIFKHAAELANAPERESWSNVYWCEGRVLKGAQRGKSILGVPTAKISNSPQHFVDGVYIGKAKVIGNDKKYRKCIVNISSCYDIKGEPQKNMAVYIKHKYSEDFYDKQMHVGIVGLLRRQQVYESEMQIRKAMDADVRVLDNYIIDKSIVFNGED